MFHFEFSEEKLTPRLPNVGPFPEIRVRWVDIDLFFNRDDGSKRLEGLC